VTVEHQGDAPQANPVTGRISHGTIQPSSRARIPEVIIQRLTKRRKITEGGPEQEDQQPDTQSSG
jgi:hypothetical protein